MKVMIAVDSSDIAETAFDFYMNTMHRPDNEVFICHEAEQPDLPHSNPTPSRIFKSNSYSRGTLFASDEFLKLLADHKKKCHELEKKYVAKCNKYPGMKYEVFVETTESSIGRSIVNKAEELEVDMIVTGSRGRGTLRRTILGSVSDYVLHHSKVPVMVCHK